MRVLVTRPQPGADRTAARLRAMGHEPVLLPLSRTVTMANGVADPAERSAGAWAVTSESALEYWKPPGEAGLALPLYAVGARTASRAAAAGFVDVREGSGTGHDLARMIIADRDTGRIELSDTHPLIYVAGHLRKDDFEVELNADEVPNRTLEVYDIKAISYSTDFIVELFREKPIDAVLLYSANAASLFLQVAHGALSRILLKNIVFFCISENTAAVVRQATATRYRVAAGPDENQLLSLL